MKPFKSLASTHTMALSQPMCCTFSANLAGWPVAVHYMGISEKKWGVA